LVQRKVSKSALEDLRNGVNFLAAGNKIYTTKPCEVKIIDPPDFKFQSPYTQNSYLDYTWLEIVLTEGKYHQVRKMVATVGHKCVRLVRTSIEDLLLGDLLDGAVEEIDENSFCDLIKIKL
jgi:23S rRNA pseudouridine2457 synthase